MGWKYTTPEEAAEARRVYAREYNRRNGCKYKAKSQASRKERYHSDPDYRERLIALGCARYAANPEPTKARTRAAYPKVKAMITARMRSIKTIFEALPEEQREEYAQWLLMVASGDSYTSQAIGAGSIDSTYMGNYAGI
ncbi:hypothetical protein [Rhizobium sp. BE258]|uniref:hypothetical protein n=1 Tax=Rhizobium sp. BE258 TaxID=2817722 RepID=UPI0028650C12|nr:hypothetical protein [Rhizobium sp. BE258]MDR7145557.1 epoxyqueuosine reductase QueG [Rhizobium sp. BE258]